MRYPNAINIIGLATETGSSQERSEDFMYLDASNWTDNENIEAENIEKELIANKLLSKRIMLRGTINEYPNEENPQFIVGIKGTERNLPCPCGSGKKFKKCCGKY